MMAPARFSIGIDLGTTNSAMAFVPLAVDAETEVVEIAQWDTPSAVADSPILPSVLYLPPRAAGEHTGPPAENEGAWIVGRLAQRRAWETPGRIVRSAKSWLCHAGADREAAFLPWGSDDIAFDEKISPVQATALILSHLRRAWNDRFAPVGGDCAFDAQHITIAVPASFDVAAQRLTLAAARTAGYPESVRLLEEPQAAFYRWLDQHDGGRELMQTLPARDTEQGHLLVVDVGGGTSDFSLFSITVAAEGMPRIKRAAVGDHILLGGDNIDLALAHAAEVKLSGEGHRLHGSSWEHLVIRCKDAKERALSEDGPLDERFAIAIPGRGSSLFEGVRSAHLTRAEMLEILLDGFFPDCRADARLRGGLSALKEWGLPYTSESAITRHLAVFLQGRPRIDAVLFNGGTFYPALLRDRICQQIGAWQQGATPLALVNRQPDLAVACGAARSGKLMHDRAERIDAGASRAVFLELHGQSGPDASQQPSPSLVCILPRGATPEQTFEISPPGLALRLNRPVVFQTYSSTRHSRLQPGDLLSWEAREMLHPLPPLQTTARLEKGAAAEHATIAVALTTQLNELGLLQVSCQSLDPAIRQTWSLDFNLRPHVAPSEPSRGTTFPKGASDALPNAEPEAMAAAAEQIGAYFAPRSTTRSKPTAARILETLEKTLSLGKGKWNAFLVRSLWPSLAAGATQRKYSADLEEAWLILAGFLLRPGFGVDQDEARIDQLWQSCQTGPTAAGKRIRIQEHILWRRVAGGLSRDRQEAVIAGDLDKLLHQKLPAPELVRLAGSLERLPQDTKIALIDRFLRTGKELAREGGHAAPFFAALGLLLNRAPLYAGPEAVVSPQLVDAAYDAFGGFDWSKPELADLQTLFLQAARVVDVRGLDVSALLRQRIASKLEKCGVPALRTAKVRAFVPIAASERLGLFGEALPAGLVIGGT